VKLAAPTTGRAGFAFPSVCWEPSTPPLLFERELLCAAAFPATAACAVTLAEPETVAEVPAEPVAVVEAAAHELDTPRSRPAPDRNKRRRTSAEPGYLAAAAHPLRSFF